MAETTFKIIGTEAACNTTASNFSSNTLLRLVNIDTSAHLVTLAYANGTAYGTCTVRNAETMYIQKAPTDLISSNAATAVVLAAGVRRGTV